MLSLFSFIFVSSRQCMISIIHPRCLTRILVCPLADWLQFQIINDVVKCVYKTIRLIWAQSFAANDRRASGTGTATATAFTLKVTVATSSWVELRRYKRAFNVIVACLDTSWTSLLSCCKKHITSSSAVAERRRDASCLSVVSFSSTNLERNILLLSRRSRQRERLSASVMSICSFVCLLVFLSVRRQNAKTCDFLKN